MINIKQLSRMCVSVACLILGSIATTSTAHAASVYLAPNSYRSFNDSPFKGGSYSYFYLEDFEDIFLNTPGVNVSAGRVKSKDNSTDSVDGDDGKIDGNGSDGHSWYSDDHSILRFTFNSSVLGDLPTNVGIVWTDVGFSSGSMGLGDVQFEAFDAFGASLGIFGLNALGDGDFRGKTLEDKFFGVSYAGGISAINISTLGSTDWEVDHLQYGRANTQNVPEPGILLSVLAVGIVGIKVRSPYRRKIG